MEQIENNPQKKEREKKKIVLVDCEAREYLRKVSPWWREGIIKSSSSDYTSRYFLLKR